MKSDRVCVHCGLCTDEIKLFEDLGPKNGAQISALATQEDFHKGDFLFHLGDAADRVFIVTAGKVKLSDYDEGGKESIYGIAMPGSVIGEESLFAKETFRVYGEALTDVEVCVLTNSDLEALVETDEDFRLNLIRGLADKLKRQDAMIRVLRIPNAKDRLEAFLKLRQDQLGDSVIELTQETISASINVARETVSRKLQALADEGVIELEGYKKIIVKNG